MKYFSILTVTIVLLFTTAAGQTRWALDKVHSNVEFTVTHMVIAEVDGRFTDFDVKFTSDGEDFSTAAVEATIQIASVNTDNERRDNHLRSADFLDAENYPVMTFTSTKFEKVNDKRYNVTGNLTIRGNTKPVVLDLRYNGKVNDSWGNTRIALKATTTIDRFEFGTVWDKALESGNLIVSRQVDITLNLQFTEVKTDQKG